MTVLLLLLVLLAGAGIIFLYTSPQFGAAATGQRLERIKRSPNYRDGKFQNLLPTDMSMSFGETVRVMVDIIKGVEGSVPKTALPARSLLLDAADTVAAPRITWFGHSAILIETGGKKIFCDPMLGLRASPFSFAGTKRFDYPLPLALDSMPELDAIVISHDHYDHLDYGSIIRLKDRTARFYVPLGVGAHLESWGVPAEKITELDWWESASFEGLTLSAAPARHFSGRGLGDRNTTLWCSWVIKSPAHTLFYGGDSGYGDHFKAIGEKYGPFDLTLLECGQYNERWPLIHMMPEQTAQAHLDLNGKVLMPIHWGAFALALHSWKEPVTRLQAAAKAGNIQLVTPEIGETVHLDTLGQYRPWWVEVE